MPKISLDNLERYDGHLKDWCDARFAERKVHENWHEAGPSGAVSFYPVPNRPIDPVVNFAFTETLPEGTKGPDNPSTITGVSSVNVGRIGKNLLLKATPTYAPDPSPVTITQNADGIYTLNGTNNTNNIIYVAITDCAYVFSGNKSSVVLNSTKSYTMSGTLISGSYTIGSSNSTYSFGYSSNNGYYSSANFPLSGKTSFTLASKPDADGKFIARMNISPGSTFANAVFAFQLEEGDTATDFEEPMLPADANYTVNLGNTYYGGSIDLATGLMTVTWKGITFTGTEEWDVMSDINGYHPYYPASSNPVVDFGRDTAGDPPKCTHANFTTAYGTNINPSQFGMWGTAGRIIMFSDKSMADWKAWLATQHANGTPVKVSWLTSVPFTVQLTPPQIYSLSQPDPYTPRINTVYSDQQSVLVRYPKSPIITGSELDNAILSLGGD